MPAIRIDDGNCGAVSSDSVAVLWAVSSDVIACFTTFADAATGPPTCGLPFCGRVSQPAPNARIKPSANTVQCRISEPRDRLTEPRSVACGIPVAGAGVVA